MLRRGERLENHVRAMDGGENDERPVKENEEQDGSQDAADQEAKPRAGICDAGAAKQRGAQDDGKVTAGDKAGEGDGHLLEEEGKQSADDTKDKGDDQHG